MTLAGLNGSWTGLSADGAVLLTATVEAGRMKLSVVERDADVARASVCNTGEVLVADGTISVGGRNAPLVLQCQIVRDWGSGWGTCSLRLRPGRPNERATDIFLFLLRDQSWLEHVLALRSRWR